mgnify:CR=1 FL=1
MKKRSYCFAALLTAAALLAGCTPADPSASSSADSASSAQASSSGETQAEAEETQAESGEKVVVGAISSPWTNLYPYEISGTYDEIMNILIFDRLMDVSMDGELVPREATEVTASEDGKTLTVSLSQDAHWHDGEPVTADDVVWSFQISCNPDLSVSRRYLMNILDGTDDEGAQLSEGSVGVSKIDDYTIEMKLKKAMDPVTVFNTLKQFVVLPKHLLEDIPLSEMHTNEFWRNPIGSGPFMYDSEITGERIELVKNEGYEYGPIDIDRLILRVVPAANMVSGLISGEIDLNMGSIGPIQPVDYATLLENDNLNVESVPCFDFQYMAINDEREYLTDDIKRAMNMAIDKQLIVDQLLYGQGTVMHSVWPESHPYYADLDWDTYNPEEAKRIVEESGWDTDRELLMLVPTGNTVREQSSAIIQQNLADVGIKVRIQTSDFATVMSECFEGNMDLALLGSAGTVEPHEVSTQFAPGTTTCFSNLQTSEYYDLFQEALEYTSYEERYPIYQEFQELFKEHTPYVTLYSPNMIEAYSKRLSNLDTRDFCQTNFAVWNWKVEE